MVDPGPGQEAQLKNSTSPRAFLPLTRPPVRHQNHLLHLIAEGPKSPMSSEEYSASSAALLETPFEEANQRYLAAQMQRSAPLLNTSAPNPPMIHIRHQPAGNPQQVLVQPRKDPRTVAVTTSSGRTILKRVAPKPNVALKPGDKAESRQRRSLSFDDRDGQYVPHHLFYLTV